MKGHTYLTPVLTMDYLFADHELKIPPERKLLRKNSSCHNEFPSIISLAFLYSCHCCTIMVMKHLPAQTSSLSYLRSGAPLKGFSQAEKDNLFSENTDNATFGLSARQWVIPDISFSNYEYVWTYETPGDLLKMQILIY